MRTLGFVLALVMVGTTASCGKGSARSTTPGPGPTYCADMGTLIEAARKNFPDMRRKDKSVTIENQPGFEATVVLPSTVACRILTSEQPYPDAYECDLAPVESQVKAKAVIDRWAPIVAACPQLGTWQAKPATDLGRSWELETDDNHLLRVVLFTAGDDKARPTLTIRSDEI